MAAGSEGSQREKSGEPGVQPAQFRLPTGAQDTILPYKSAPDVTIFRQPQSFFPGCGGAAVEPGAGLPSTVLASISSIRVPSGSYKLICRFRLTPV